jgi:hypothetical protein
VDVEHGERHGQQDGRGSDGRDDGPAQRRGEDRRPEAVLAVAAAQPPEDRDPALLDAVAELRQQRGSTVSDPSMAMPTTIIVPMPKPRYALSPENTIPAMAMITVTPEISTERPEVAAAASSAARWPLPAARSSRSRLR